MNIKRMWVNGFFILAVVLSTCHAQLLTETNLVQEAVTGRVDSLVVSAKALLGEKDIAPMKVIRVARGLMYRIGAIEVDDLLGPNPAHPLLEFGKKSTPESRRSCVMNVLGTNLYVELESRFLKSLETSTNDLEKIAAFEILSKGLNSSNAVGIIVKDFNSNLCRLEDDSTTNKPGRSLLFWTAESLCYLGQTNGLEIMSWALESKKTSQAEKLVAIKALVVLQVREARETLLQSAKSLAFSDDSHVASDTFDALHRVPEFREIGTRAGEAQLERLKGLCEKAELNKDAWLLLHNVSSYFDGVQEKGQLSLDDQRKVKRIAVDIIRIGRKQASETVASLFETLAADEDAQVIKELLKSDSARVRRQAVWSVLKCTPDVRKSLLSDVMPSLEDEDIQNRKAAIDVIRLAKGEKKLKEVNSEKEFKAEMDSIKAWWLKENH